MITSTIQRFVLPALAAGMAEGAAVSGAAGAAEGAAGAAEGAAVGGAARAGAAEGAAVGGGAKAGPKMGGVASDLIGGVGQSIATAKDPGGTAVRKGTGVVNSGISALRDVADAGTDRFYSDLDEIDRRIEGLNESPT